MSKKNPWAQDCEVKGIITREDEEYLEPYDERNKKGNKIAGAQRHFCKVDIDDFSVGLLDMPIRHLVNQDFQISLKTLYD